VNRVCAQLRRVRCERGYSLMEMLTVLTILSTVVTTMTGLFVSGNRSEADLRNRVQAQTEAVTALDRLRRDVHCASAATASSATSVTMSVPCVSGGVVSWCTASVAGSTSRYTLHRRPTTGTCDSTTARFVDYLTTGNVFTYEIASINNLAKLRVSLPVKLRSMTSPYTLCDVLVMRNSLRAGSPGTPVPAC
jgi:prepilin-type N-terminal cleavage/methylation domain-containing protein